MSKTPQNIDSQTLMSAIYDALEAAKETKTPREKVIIGLSLESVLQIADKLQDLESTEELLDNAMLDEMVSTETEQ